MTGMYCDKCGYERGMPWCCNPQEQARLAKENKSMTKGSGIVDFSLLYNWQNQIETEQIKWAKTVTKDLTEERLDDYRAGLQAGMRAIISTLKIQGILSEKI
jgi:GH25 family lysozyme M1 (1,4-beta-N-acetylmuramidase)